MRAIFAETLKSIVRSPISTMRPPRISGLTYTPPPLARKFLHRSQQRPLAHLRHNLQLLPLPNVLTLTHHPLQLLDHLLVQRTRTCNHHLHLALGRAHQRAKLLAHAIQQAQPVVLRQRLEEMLQRLRLIGHVGRFLQLGNDLLLVAFGEGGGVEDVLEAGVAFEGLGEVVEGAGDGVQGALFGGCSVL